MLRAAMLVPAGDGRARSVEPSLAAGSRVAGARVEGLIQVLEDGEVWRGYLGEQPVAVKVARSSAGWQALQREVAALTRLGGVAAPVILVSELTADPPA